MSAIHKTRAAESAKPFSRDEQPIQFLTERGFAIVRRCDVDGSTPASHEEHCYIVRDVEGHEFEVFVRFTGGGISDLIERSHHRVSLSSVFWIVAAERHLAEYLDLTGDVPSDGALLIMEPNLDDIDLATRWNTNAR